MTETKIKPTTPTENLAPRSRHGGVPDEQDAPGYTDEELALMVAETSERKTAAATGLQKTTIHRAVVRHRKAEAEAIARAVEERRRQRQAVNIMPELDDAPTDGEATQDEREPVAVPDDTRIRVGAQRTGGIGSLFLRAATESASNPDAEPIPLTIISQQDWDAAIAWARSPSRERAFTIDDPTPGARGFVVLPTFKANPSQDQADAQEHDRAVWRAWMANEFHERGWIVRYGTDVPADEADRSSYSRIFVIAGSAVQCLALVGSTWTPDLLRRQCRILVFDARNQGLLPGQTRPTDIDNRVKLDEFTIDIGPSPTP